MAFGVPKADGKFSAEDQDCCEPLSLKIRPTGGCFHRPHAPEAYRLIDSYIAKNPIDASWIWEEHETGPEILLWAATGTAGLVFAKSLIELITAVVKARSEGQKRGDQSSASLEIIVRGYRKDGEYIEERILRIPPGNEITPKEIAAAFQSKAIKPLGRRKRK